MMDIKGNHQDSWLSLTFKGAREYLAGTDIFNQINVIIAAGTATKDTYIQRIVFRKLATRRCYLVLDNDNKYARDASLIADVKLLGPTTGASLSLRILEGDVPVTERSPYDEDSIVTAAVLDGDHRKIRINVESSYSTIEVIVALTKHLHNSLYAIENGKWLFAQLDLEQALPYVYSDITIENRSLIGNRFTVNSIILDGEYLGTIRFMVGNA